VNPRAAIRCTAGLLALACLALPACKPPAPSPPAPLSLDKVTPDLNLTAADFLRDFDGQKYAGKVIEITGIYFTWTLVDDGHHATDLSLLASGWPDKLVFALDRKVMDQKWLILDYWSLVRMRGRYAGRDADGTVHFTDSVLISRYFEAKDYPTAIKVQAPELARAFWDTDSGSSESREYAGRVIEVTGTVVSVEGREVALDTGEAEHPLRCRLEEVDASIAPGQTISLKGYCWENTVEMTRLAVRGGIRP